MRETRLSGSEGGGARTRSPYPYPLSLFFAKDSGGRDRPSTEESVCGVLPSEFFFGEEKGAGQQGARSD